MDNKNLNISEELLNNLSVDEIIDLKVEVDNLLDEINDAISICNEAIQS